MSIVPKTKVSASKKRSKIDLSCDSGTTTNFGFIQPTFAREMIPNSKFEVSVNSRVLNAPMPVPTYGRLNLLHKHVFVPYIDVCPQFQSFLSGQSYRSGSASIAYIPNSLPRMDLVLISQWILSHFADWSIFIKFDKNNYTPSENPNPFADLGFNDYEYKPVLLSTENPTTTELNAAKTALGMVYTPTTFSGATAGYFYGRSLNASQWTGFRNDLNKLLPSGVLLDGRGIRNGADVRAFGNLLLGGWFYEGDAGSFMDSSIDDFSINDYDSNPNGNLICSPSFSYVPLETADYISKFGTTNGLDIVVAFKLRPAAKRFRSILLGLGYQFTPNLAGKVDPANWLKLFAFYKAWFNCYRPKRELTFTNTYCYEMIKLCESSTAEQFMYADYTPGSSYYISDLVCNFIMDCCYTSYYLPQDYFGMSVTKPNINYANEGQSSSIDVPLVPIDAYPSDSIDQRVHFGSSYSPSVFISKANNNTTNVHLSPLALKVGQLVLKYVNKNTIAGRSIVDYYRVHYGINLSPSHDTESVFEIGDVRIPIDINIVQSQAGTDTDELGSYAAFGIGYNKKGNKFVYENGSNDGDFGVWITLTTVVPKSGYSQGVLRENDNIKRFDFFTGEFDAAGFDIIKRSEVSADYPTQVTEFNQVSDINFDLKKGFGFVPRYSAYKVSRNILSGELSLRGSQSQYGGYSLDRKIPYEQTLPSHIYISSEHKYYNYGRLAKPSFVPSIIFDNFRRLDFSDRLGNYNRIFYSESTLDDHFIITSTFKVDAWLPVLPLSESFDTLSDDDGKVIDVTHS